MIVLPEFSTFTLVSVLLVASRTAPKTVAAPVSSRARIFSMQLYNEKANKYEDTSKSYHQSIFSHTHRIFPQT